jgi:hypothetical protein
MMAMVAVGVMMKLMSHMEITVTVVLSNLTSLNRVMSTYQCQSQSHKNGSTGEFTARLWWYRACCPLPQRVASLPKAPSRFDPVV